MEKLANEGKHAVGTIPVVVDDSNKKASTRK
jgi:hypothetical protein